jgi:mono/diheme cytochrome c family protein
MLVLRVAAGLLMAAMLIAGCSPQQVAEVKKPPAGAKSLPGTPPPAEPAADKDLGRSIYATGIGAARTFVTFEKGPEKWREKPTGCATCHGEDGRGVQTPQGKSPAVTYASLREAEEGKTPHFPSDEALKQAIVEGVEEGGEQLSAAMPRWKLSDEEFGALLDYLKSLDKPAAQLPGKG